jgi:uncharacterized protein YjbJ (UPF0337 family)
LLFAAAASERSAVVFVELQAALTLASLLEVTRGRPDTNEKETQMDWNRVEGNWKQFKGKVKEQWGKLTDDDLDTIAGKRDQLEGKIQERYGIEKDRVRRDVDDWYGRLN